MATASRADQRRARVLEATIAAIADVGVDALRMTDISERAGMTPGHILYYFGNKDRILIETLRWSEHDLAESRRAAPVGGLAHAGVCAHWSTTTCRRGQPTPAGTCGCRSGSTRPPTRRPASCWSS